MICSLVQQAHNGKRMFEQAAQVNMVKALGCRRSPEKFSRFFIMKKSGKQFF